MNTSSPSTPAATLELLSRLELMHPNHQWKIEEIGDYGQNAERGAPDLLILFGRPNIDGGFTEHSPDAYTTLYGEVAEPAHWGLSLEAGELIREHNQIFVATLDEYTSPYFLAMQANAGHSKHD